MSIVVSIIAALLVLSILVAIHEGGHFLAGKLLGFKILEFSIGMGPKLLKKEKNGTVYSLRAFPIGGMCAFAGEDGEVKEDGDFNSFPAWKRFIVAFAGPFMNIVFAFILGIIVMMIFGGTGTVKMQNPVVSGYSTEEAPAKSAGLLPYDMVTKVNGKEVSSSDEMIKAIKADTDGDIELEVIRPTMPTLTVNGMIVPAEEAQDLSAYFKNHPMSEHILTFTNASGCDIYINTTQVLSDTPIDFNVFMQNHPDRLGSYTVNYMPPFLINGSPITATDLNDLTVYVEHHPEESYVASYKNTSKKTITINNTYNKKEGINMIGASVYDDLGYYSRDYNFFSAFPAGIDYVADVTGQMYSFLGSLFTGGVNVKDMSGIVGIVDVVNQGVSGVMQAEQPTSTKISNIIMFVFYLAVILSLNLGIINLLPLPALDGGRILLNIIEMIVRKPIPTKVEGMVHSVGFILLMALIVVITLKDIVFLFR